MLRYSQRARGRARRILVSLVEDGHVAAEGQPFNDRDAGNYFDALRIDAAGITCLRTKKTLGAWNCDDQIVHPARKVGGGKRCALAKVRRETAVVFARDFSLEIGIADVRENYIVERRRAK